MGWVTERHRCTLDMAFEDLRASVQSDVNEANSLSGEEPERFHFEPSNSSGDRFLVTGFPLDRRRGGTPSKFVFQLDREAKEIRISRNRPDTLGGSAGDIVVGQRWDIESASCKLCMNGRLVTVVQVSQAALEPMFFACVPR